MEQDAVDFFVDTRLLRPGDLDEVRQQLADFVAKHLDAGRLIALVTSGGTTVPLEVNTVRFVDNFSTGTRGAKCTEAFLKLGYAVVFLHRTGSRFPFLASLQGRLSARPAEVLDQASHPSGSAEALLADPCPPDPLHLLALPFTTIFDYLFLLREASQALAPAGPTALSFAAAAVSDFYMPEAEMATEKIQSRSQDGLFVQLRNVPKLLGAVRAWAPAAFLVSFKLETNRNILDAKAAGALKKYSVDAVCANMLQHVRDWVAVVRKDLSADCIEIADQEGITGEEAEPIAVSGVISELVELGASEDSTSAGEGDWSLDGALVTRIAALHQEHIDAGPGDAP